MTDFDAARYVTEKRLGLFDAATPAKFRGATFADFDQPMADLARGWCHQPDGALIIYGPTGTGKTRLMYATARYLVGLGAQVRIWPVVELIDHARDSINAPVAASAFHAAADVDVLGLDDLGAERVTDWTRERLHALIDTRWQHERPLMATTNVTAEALAEAVGERATSRLWHNATLIGVLGADRRTGRVTTPTRPDF